MELDKRVTPGFIKALRGRARAMHFTLDTNGVSFDIEVEHGHRYRIGLFDDMDEADAAATVIIAEPELRWL